MGRRLNAKLTVATVTLASCGLVLIASAAAAPHAARVQVQDPAGGPPILDIREVDATSSPQTLDFTIVTWSRWRTRTLRDRAYLLVHLDTLAVPGYDYYVLLRSNGRRIRGVLFRASARKRDRAIARIRAWRVDRASVSFTLPRSKVQLTGPARAYSWYAQSLVTSVRCKRVCFDLAPDVGAAQDFVPPG